LKTFRLEFPGRDPLELGRPARVMGIVNVTPDSFSDGGDHADPDAAVRAGLAMVEAGADLLDVGGESTRPGARPTDESEEASRILPVVERLAREAGVPISVDTRRARVARRALDAGASLVNDVSGLADREMAGVIAAAGVPLILMHSRGTPATMRERTDYDDLVTDVVRELRAGLARARDAGIGAIVVDPGIGFAKTADQSFELLRDLPRFAELGHPILIGPSRKSFLSRIRDVPPKERLYLTLGAVLAGVAAGAHIVRVHDVGPTVDALRSFEAARPRDF
jgi:dihydropteroate synthase